VHGGQDATAIRGQVTAGLGQTLVAQDAPGMVSPSTKSMTSDPTPELGAVVPHHQHLGNGDTGPVRPSQQSPFQAKPEGADPAGSRRRTRRRGG